MSYLVALLIIFLCFLAFVIYQWLKVFGKKSFKANLKDCVFYIRWFIIGKYHCPASESTKLFYKGLNKAFWGCVVVAVTITLGKFVEIINTFLV